MFAGWEREAMSNYQSMTGMIQCTVEGGFLFWREWNPNSRENHSVWVKSIDIGDLQALEGLKAEWATAKQSPSEESFRLGCMYCCATDHRPCPWYVEPTSERLTREIETLMVKREEALAAEMGNRPEVLA